VGFRLWRKGETLNLFAPDLVLVDGVEFGLQVEDLSEGRHGDGLGESTF
jgi:hypothetical protein